MGAAATLPELSDWTLILQISDIEYFEKNHRSTSPDYKQCIDIPKMC